MAVAEFGIGARFKILNLEVQLLSATPTLKEVIMKNMSQQKKALIAAFDKGYRVPNDVKSDPELERLSRNIQKIDSAMEDA